MKRVNSKKGLLICAAITGITIIARITRLDTINVGYLIFHFLYFYLFIVTIWFFFQFLLSNSKKTVFKIGSFLFFSGFFSILYQFIIQHSFDHLFLSYFDFPALQGLKDVQLNAMLFLKGTFFAGLIIIICYYLNVTIEKQHTLLEIESLKKENAIAELNSLKQQISPHFLFNSLSTLQTIVANESSREFILKISNVYRYLLSNSENHLVALQDELRFSESYLYILQERFEDGLLVNISIAHDLLDLQIPPFSLQLLIENAIKHNVVSIENPLQISIFNDESKNILVCNNLQPKMVVEKSTKIGLENIKKRYSLLSKKQIEIVNDGQQFLVKLPLIN